MQATYTVGAGGSPPNEGAIGNPGSSSLFSLSGVTLQANGGGGAGQGSGGSASGGSVNCSGGQGGTSVTPNGADAQCGFAGGGGGGCQFGFCGNGGANEIFTGGTGFNTQWSIQNRGWGASGAGGPRGIGLDGNGEDGGQSGNSPPGAGGGAAWGSFTGVFDGEHGMIRILEGVNLDISNYYLD